MATLNYTVLQGQTIFDIAAKLYNDFPLGLSDLLQLNNISLSSSLPTTLTYTPGLTRNVPKYNIPIIDNPQQSFIVREGQTIYDLAIQLYGKFEGIGNLISLLPSLDTDLTPGSVILYPEDLTADNAKFLTTLVCSKPLVEGYLLQETGFGFTLEDGTGKIKLE